MQTAYIDHTDGVVDFAELQLPEGDDIELEVADCTLSSLVLKNFHLIGATGISVGSNISYALSAPIELPQSVVSYTGPVLDKMILPSGLKSLTIVETPKSGHLSRINLPVGLQTLAINLTDTFSPVDDMRLPQNLLKLSIHGEHNCSLEMLKIPRSMNYLNTGSSVQPVDRLQSSLLDLTVISKSTRLMQSADSGTERFKEHLTLTPSLPVVTEIHQLLPSLENVSVILDQTMWQSVGDIWCRLLLEGRVRLLNLVVVNNSGNRCMRDFGEVLFRSEKLGRPICQTIRVVGETFEYATCLRVAEAVRKFGADLKVDLDYMTPFPACALHRIASVLGATVRDSDLVYHSQDTNVEFRPEDTTLSFTKKVASDSFSEFDDDLSYGYGPTPEPEPSAEHKPIFLYSWVDCGFCKKQEEVIDKLLTDSDIARKFNRLVSIKQLQNPQDADDPRVKAFPTWVVNDVLAPGFKQEEEVLRMLDNF